MMRDVYLLMFCDQAYTDLLVAGYRLSGSVIVKLYAKMWLFLTLLGGGGIN